MLDNGTICVEIHKIGADGHDPDFRIADQVGARGGERLGPRRARMPGHYEVRDHGFSRIIEANVYRYTFASMEALIELIRTDMRTNRGLVLAEDVEIALPEDCIYIVADNALARDIRAAGATAFVISGGVLQDRAGFERRIRSLSRSPAETPPRPAALRPDKG